MTKVKSRRFAFAGVLAAMLMGLLGALASNAHAGDPAWLQGGPTYMTAPGPEGGDPAIMLREIYLAEGTYSWDVWLSGPSSASIVSGSSAHRSIWLATGSYWWACYLQPGNYYQFTCSLNDGVHGNAYLQSSYFALPSTGSYVMNSMLDN